ncbi:MAG: hypothetical protein U1A72_13350 [Sulfuritalea sp.]|nr:hypothetical protein [Sulfuritalea sp.]
MTALFSSPKLPAPAPVVAAPSREDPAVEEARRKTIIQARLARGRASTIQTQGGGQGGPALLASKQLLAA